MSKNEIFEAHPKLDCYFETSDGSCFYTENAAEAHAKTLKDKKVKSVVNKNVKSAQVEANAELDAEKVNNSKAVEDNASKEVAAAENKK